MILTTSEAEAALMAMMPTEIVHGTVTFAGADVNWCRNRIDVDSNINGEYESYATLALFAKAYGVSCYEPNIVIRRKPLS